MPNLRRWLSASKISENNDQEMKRRQKDEEDGQFCDSLLGLMKHTGRFDYIDLTKDDKPNDDDGGGEAAGKDTTNSSRAKRFSWTR